MLRIVEAGISISCVCIQITVGLCRIEIERQKKQSHGNTKIYVVRLWPISMGGVKEKVSLTKKGDYKGGTKTHSQNPNLKCTQKSSQSPVACD